MSNSNFSVDVRLINNRKFLAVQEIKAKNLSNYDERSELIKLNWKVEVILEATKGLYDLGIQHSCDIKELWVAFEGIAKSAR